MTLELDLQHTAVLFMDFQRDIALPGGPMAPASKEALARYAAAMERTAAVLRAVRTADVLRIHVGVAFRPGHPEANPNTRMGHYMITHSALIEGSEGAAFVPALAPKGEEIVIIKRSVSAFCHTDLEVILRNAGVHTLILTGLTTHFVVEGTARAAADLGFRVITLSDCCASGGVERHTAALDILGFLGPVVPASTFLGQLDA